MPRPNDLTKSVIDRLMNLQEFTVSVSVEENWMPNGRVPFDISIKNGIATVKIPALNEDEAKQKVFDYFNNNDVEEE